MADKTAISWTDATWQVITGCKIVSPGCANCYAMKLAGGRLRHHPSRAGLTKITKAGRVWTGEARFNEQWLDQPLRWTRPRKIFVCAHADLFYDGVPDSLLSMVFAVMALAPQHTFQVLTKRSARMRAALGSPDFWASVRADAEAFRAARAGRPVPLDPRAVAGMTHGVLPNVWLGVSAETQHYADLRIHDLRLTPAARRFVSAEPLLGEIDLDRGGWSLVRRLVSPAGDIYNGLDWVIVGGESGSRARPMNPAWARKLRDQCREAGTAFFFKQWGAFAPLAGDTRTPRNRLTINPFGDELLVRVGKNYPAMLDGRTWEEFPIGAAP